MIENLKLGKEWNFLKLIKGIYQKLTDKIKLIVKMWMLSPKDREQGKCACYS